MNSVSKYSASLDIGSSKICCVIVTKDQHEISQIIGIGYNEAKGVSNGIISDFGLATKSIIAAISEAESQANIKINEISISASSKVVTTKIFQKKIDISDDRIDETHINETLRLILDEDYFQGKQVLHAAPISCSIDDANDIKNPIGMYGSSLEVEFIISYIGKNHYKNYLECIANHSLDIGQIVFSGFASGIAVLNDNELDLGCAVLEIGASTTSLSIFAKGNFLFSEVINFGGNNISEAIARFFGISFREAEKIKVMHASAVEHSADKGISFEVPSINFENNDNFVHISKKDLHEVIKPHLENIFKWTKSVINNSGYSNIISRQLVMTGGGSQLDGLVILAKDYLDYNSRIGLPREFKINLESPLNPSHSVALGIIQSVFKANEEEKTQFFRSLKTKKNKFSFFRNWMTQNFF